ncbi:hypothetical protein ELI07_32755 (plasmid) [Rhizobium leguminosarum]|uniref:hypothetical protein n=1 Tax=Rhizobium leguminosarum TaxID=384 RepID=UPI0010317B2D|nr:hypothetical protein [Rhizobium leguminosarum]TAX01962.1 hypothetical protein ELI07_32755 [Rhizobium leguminosarum]TAZ03230.1 hypothetical protein ELH81_30910 [Rhizobium leguminosarum]
MASRETIEPEDSDIVREKLAASTDFPQARLSLSKIKPLPAVLQLPIKWKLQSKATGPAIAAQLAITWSARSKEFALQLGDDEPAEKAAETFLAQMYGIVAAMMADKVIGRDGKRDISQAIWRMCQTRATTMDRGDLRALVRGRSIPLICVDHSSLWRLQPLYYPSKALTSDPVRSVDDFGHLIGDALRVLGQEQRLANIHIGSIAILVRELFANTHHHARTDLNGSALRRSVRAVNFALRSVDPTNVASSGRLKILAEYYQTFADIRTSTEMPFAEISVIDSGPGLAARRRQQQLAPETSIQDEIELVRDCFRKATSSFNTIAHGWGLPRVMQILKSSGGFIKIRTGRLSLYRWFDPHSRSDVSFDEDDIDFKDTEFGDDIVPHAPVTGAAITILFPLGLDS